MPRLYKLKKTSIWRRRYRSRFPCQLAGKPCGVCPRKKLSKATAVVSNNITKKQQTITAPRPHQQTNPQHHSLVCREGSLPPPCHRVKVQYSHVPYRDRKVTLIRRNSCRLSNTAQYCLLEVLYVGAPSCLNLLCYFCRSKTNSRPTESSSRIAESSTKSLLFTSSRRCSMSRCDDTL